MRTWILSTLVMTLGLSHCCHLSCPALELLLLLSVPAFGAIWVAKAESRGESFLRSVGAIGIAVAIQLSYLGWLHSDSFPKALLASEARPHAPSAKEPL